MKVTKNLRKKLIYLALAIIFIVLLLPPTLFADKNYSTVILDENNKILRIFLNKEEQWYLKNEEAKPIPDKLKKAIITFEDQYFYYHFGINPFSIAKSFFSNLSKGSVVRGGSTITMQVSRISEPKRRTYFNKIKEILQALKIELWYSKEAILRMYIDNAPYGLNIIGYQAATLKYYQKNPSELTWSEAATLAVLPNAPGLISPITNKKFLIAKKNSLLKKLLETEVIDTETYTLAINEPVPDKLNEIELVAPHLAQRLKDSYKDKSIIKTTLNKEIQVNLENILSNHLKMLNMKGIKNSSAIIVDTETGQVKAYLGSQNFFDKASKGEVDGVIAPRSTGSILKPFLYALAIDDGLILPETQIKDTPSYFGSFAPENADKKFSGIVTAKEALVRSLNIPPVNLLNEYGTYEFYSFLKKAGLTTLFRNSDDYGLTLILGGAEANLFDLAKLYRGLGNYGIFEDLKIAEIEEKKATNSKENLISRGSAYLTLNMLKDLKRPDSELYWQQYENQFKVAWKTGTSFGNRDAWAVGVNPKWTVAVWVGNFTGEGNPNLAGAISAGSLMFDIFNYLPKDKSKFWFKPPYEDLTKSEICFETGYKAGQDCEKKISVEIPVNMKPLKICPYHKNIFVTLDEKKQVCSLCWQQGNFKPIKRLFYPPDVVQYLRQRGFFIEDIPVHNESCSSIASNKVIKIIYPLHNAKIFIPKDFDKQSQKLTLKVAHGESATLIYWYLDHKFLGTSNKEHSKSVILKAGLHELEVVDEKGNRTSTSFYTLQN